MKCLIHCLTLFSIGVTQQAFAAPVVRIADGDCAALSAAAASAPGQEPSLIVLAKSGNYAACSLDVHGNIAIDGAGALMPLLQYQSEPQISVAGGARLTMRNINLGFPPSSSAASKLTPKFISNFMPAVLNDGTLVLESVSASDMNFGYTGTFGQFGGGFVRNNGSMVVRNSSFVRITDAIRSLFNGNVEISNSTISTTELNGYFVFAAGTVSVANSIVSNSLGTLCPTDIDLRSTIVSRGGNVLSDASCAFNAANDRVATDMRFLDFGAHGGVVKTLALNFDSPAIGNGVVANCEATDARGLSRGATACDSGAYEVGAGDGKLSKTGMSGLYFNASNNGHYISIQKLYKDAALVIWNTFDENGVPAWLYGVGTFSGNQIHVPQVARNIGGKLHPGGSVDVSTPTLWGSFDVNLNDCYNATLTYSSPLAEFGSGTTTLQRLAFLDGVDCAR